MIYHAINNIVIIVLGAIYHVYTLSARKAEVKQLQDAETAWKAEVKRLQADLKKMTGPLNNAETARRADVKQLEADLKLVTGQLQTAEEELNESREKLKR